VLVHQLLPFAILILKQRGGYFPTSGTKDRTDGVGVQGMLVSLNLKRAYANQRRIKGKRQSLGCRQPHAQSVEAAGAYRHNNSFYPAAVYFTQQMVYIG